MERMIGAVWSTRFTSLIGCRSAPAGGDGKHRDDYAFCVFDLSTGTPAFVPAVGGSPAHAKTLATSAVGPQKGPRSVIRYARSVSTVP